MSACAAWCAVFLALACDPATPAPVLDLPERPVDALSGSEIPGELRPLDLVEREERIYAEVADGNVPAWLRRLEPVEMAVEVDGHVHRLTFWATPDYLALGSDDDFVLVPVSPALALRIAGLVGASLPTAPMVDAIWEAAHARLVPVRIRPDQHRESVEYFRRHDRIVQAQRRLYGIHPGTFVAGHKLDIVLAGDPSRSPASLALYGWHHTDGQPIQPLFAVTMDRRPHFSLGLRLVYRGILVDGARRDLAEVLRDPALGPLLMQPTSRPG